MWEDAPAESDADAVRSYVYDPSKPTPSVGGASFNPFNAGRKDCRYVILHYIRLQVRVEAALLPCAHVRRSCACVRVRE